MQVKCLSLWEPWATLCVLGAKRYETRSWDTGYTGWLAIQAAQRFMLGQRVICRRSAFREALGQWGVTKPFKLGSIVGAVRLTGCILARDAILTESEKAFGDFSTGRYAWCFTDPIIFDSPIETRGWQRLWNPDPDLLIRITEGILAKIE